MITNKSYSEDLLRINKNKLTCKLTAPSIKYNEMYSFNIGDNKQTN